MGLTSGPPPEQSIEFDLADAAAGIDEELDERPGPAWLRTPRRRVVVVFAVVALTATGIGVRLASRPHRGTGAALAAVQAPVAPPTSGPPTSDPPRADPTRFRLAHGRGLPADPINCPEPMRCAILTQLPKAFVAAVRARLPGADLGYQLDVVRTDIPAVHFRQLDTTYGTTDLVITVLPLSIGMPGAATDSVVYASGGTIGFVWEVAGGYAIQVQFSGPLGWRPTLSELHDLAADPRLRELG